MENRLGDRMYCRAARLEAKFDDRSIQVDSGIDGVQNRLDAKIDGVETRLGAVDRLDAKIETVKDSLASAKVWALALYIALAASMLGTMARGFGWL